MMPKEESRMFSHKFHGRGAGKMKQEKRMKQYQEDLKTKQMKASDTPLLAMEKMREAQASTERACETRCLKLVCRIKTVHVTDLLSGLACIRAQRFSLADSARRRKPAVLVEVFLRSPSRQGSLFLDTPHNSRWQGMIPHAFARCRRRTIRMKHVPVPKEDFSSLAFQGLKTSYQPLRKCW
ncbi:hypothetical protein AXF42_Ash006139 [Apostasia shenzhenica]|uniref:Uncharacterized protein n=1 Tax=Apostasia shenzhenica TaxID=1088818 RepID=A0A2I0B0B0_9ASPA|nr:hypothetical protein AXF42_Ash006139 [Apostasia shenzhenica]